MLAEKAKTGRTAQLGQLLQLVGQLQILRLGHGHGQRVTHLEDGERLQTAGHILRNQRDHAADRSGPHAAGLPELPAADRRTAATRLR